MVWKDFSKVTFVSSTIRDGNMSLSKGDQTESLENRRSFLGSLGLSFDNIVAMAPPHKTDAAQVTEADLGRGAQIKDDAFFVDALITNQKGVYLFLLTGDCLPIAFYDPKRKVIALAHGSWDNVDRGLIENILRSMSKNFYTQVRDVLVLIGPSIGPCCYAGLDDLEQKDDPHWQPFIFKKNGKYGVNLWGFTEDRLQKNGLRPENIYNQKVCTYHSGQYFSHRKFVAEKLELDERFATVLGMKNL